MEDHDAEQHASSGHPCWMRRNTRRMQNEDELYYEEQE